MSDATKKGYHDEGAVGQKQPRGENSEKNQVPTKPKENVSSDRGSFKLC
jgi:hypothetical protein